MTGGPPGAIRGTPRARARGPSWPWPAPRSGWRGTPTPTAIPLHFIARVTAFRRAIGAADVPWSDKLLGYPRALVEETPEAALLGACGLAGLVSSRELRRRWGWAATAALAVLAFLVAGDLGDGAPTHHPARALGSLWWIFVGMGVDALRVAMAGDGRSSCREPRGDGRRRGRVDRVPPGAMGRVARTQRAGAPRRADREGLDLRARDVVTAEITPCQFEHFATIAAWGEPERARVHPRTQEAPTIDCPRVTTP